MIQPGAHPERGMMPPISNPFQQIGDMIKAGAKAITAYNPYKPKAKR